MNKLRWICGGWAGRKISVSAGWGVVLPCNFALFCSLCFTCCTICCFFTFLCVCNAAKAFCKYLELPLWLKGDLEITRPSLICVSELTLNPPEGIVAGEPQKHNPDLLVRLIYPFKIKIKRFLRSKASEEKMLEKQKHLNIPQNMDLFHCWCSKIATYFSFISIETAHLLIFYVTGDIIGFLCFRKWVKMILHLTDESVRETIIVCNKNKRNCLTVALFVTRR